MKKLFYSKFNEIYFFSFLYFLSLFLSYLFQYVLTHYLPSLHASNGLLLGDNIYFHDLAVKMSQNVRLHGWHEWQIYSDKSIAGTLNVAVASVFYYFFGSTPSVLLPYNVFLHVLSAFVFFKILMMFSGDKLSAYLASFIFSFLPVTFVWVAQIHKDIYAILAWYLLLYAIILNLKGEPGYKVISFCFIALFLLLLTRPFYLYLAALILFIDIVHNLFIIHVRKSLLISIGAVLLCLGFISYFHFSKPVFGSGLDSYNMSNNKRVKALADNTAGYKLDLAWNGLTKNTIAEPLFIALQTLRVNQLFLTDSEARSTIDKDFIPHSEWDFIEYVPKAIAITFLYPHPFQLLEINNIKAIISLLEMLIYYFFLIHLLLHLSKYLKNQYFQKLFLFSFIPSLLLSYINPVIGTYHRIRYPFFCLILGLGVCAFMQNRSTIFHILKKYKK